MSESIQITFRATSDTPPEYRRYDGETVDLPAGQLLPTRGMLLGRQGRLDGYEWFMEPVEMRSPSRIEIDTLLASAADLLRFTPRAIGSAEEVARRHAEAQHCLLKAQLLLIRADPRVGQL